MTTLLTVSGVVKEFPGVRALDGVDLEVEAGEVHCLLGQNGAGKSTLIKVLSAAHRADAGEIRWKGEPVSFPTPVAALRAGLATIYQELDLVDGLSVAENIFLGHEASSLGFSKRGEMNQAARRPAQAARPQRDPAGAGGRLAVRGRQAGGQHGPGAVPRRAADHHGRAVRGAGQRRGGQPLPGDPAADRRRRRGHLHLAPARRDPGHRRPGHRAEGRPHGRRRAAGPIHAHLRGRAPDDRPERGVRLPALRGGARPTRPRSCGWRASAAAASSPTSPSASTVER